jgi:two-component system response regulator HupR/HoxA
MSEIAAATPEDSTASYGILIVDDEEAILESLEFTLGAEYRVFTATNGDEGLEILEREEVALVIADQNMPGMKGVEFLEKVIERDARTIRMMLTGYADISSLVRAINSGHIYRYITKPWEPDELRLNVKRALEAYRLTFENTELADALARANKRLRDENLYLRGEVERRYSFDGIIGDSRAMQRVFELMAKVAETDATVLVTGETGTGKEMVARAVHYTGSRHERRFVAQNCGALPDTLLESELFGHKRGAFTGANQDKLGLFEAAHGGTIFLDEIGETEPGMQVRLLRVLQDGEIRPVGSSDTRHVDVRVVAATNRDLADAVKNGRFREDLFYRLRVVEIPLPPLRERASDIPALAHHFLEVASKRMSRHLTGFSNAAMDSLCAYEWRGNVRELENEIERVCALAGKEEMVALEMLSEHVRGGGPRGAAAFEGLDDESIRSWNLNDAVDDLKRQRITAAIQETGSKTRAAERLGIPRQSLQKMMKRLQLTDEEVQNAG